MTRATKHIKGVQFWLKKFLFKGYAWVPLSILLLLWSSSWLLEQNREYVVLNTQLILCCLASKSAHNYSFINCNTLTCTQQEALKWKVESSFSPCQCFLRINGELILQACLIVLNTTWIWWIYPLWKFELQLSNCELANSTLQACSCQELGTWEPLFHKRKKIEKQKDWV